MKVIGVNGINNNGEASTDKMLQGLWSRGIQVHDLYINKSGMVAVAFESILGLFTRKRNSKRLDRDAARLKAVADPGDCVIAHSRGAAVTLRAMELGAKFKNVYLFAPAIERNVTFPPGAMNKCIVFFHKHDRAMWAAVRVPFHYFGDMGAKGYKGDDRRVLNMNTTGLLRRDDKTFTPWHSAYFSDVNIARYEELIFNDIKSS